jgi:phage terminase Nu1 subunit (DNA packaging protein)
VAAVADDEPGYEPDRTRAEARRAEAEASIAELKLAQMRGELIPICDVERELERAFTAVRARLLAIPPKLAPVLSPEKPARARMLLEQAVLETLAELQSLGGDQNEADEADALVA